MIPEEKLDWRRTEKPTASKSNWLITDSEVRFNQNKANRHKYHLLKNLGYLDTNAIVYDLDDDGFRRPLEYGEKKFLALGCSYTYGIGLAANEIWPNLLGETANATIFNGSQPGASTDTAFRLLKVLLKREAPEAVFHLVTHPNRREIIFPELRGNYPWAYGPWDFGKESLRSYTEIVTNEHSSAIHQEKNLLAMAHLCHLAEIPYIEIIFENTVHLRRDNTDTGRDLGHPGKRFHRALADEMYRKYRNLSKTA